MLVKLRQVLRLLVISLVITVEDVTINKIVWGKCFEREKKIWRTQNLSLFQNANPFMMKEDKRRKGKVKKQYKKKKGKNEGD